MIHVSSSPSSRGISRIGISVCPGQLSGITAVLHNNRAQDCEEEEEATVMRKRRNIGTMKWKRWRRGELGPKIQKFSSVWQSMDGNNSSNVFQPHFPGALILCSRISLRGEKQPTYTALETKSKWEAYLVLYLYIKHCFVVTFNVWINKNNSAFLVSGIVTYWIIFPFQKTFPRRDDAETFLGVGQAWECEQGGNWQQRNAQSVSPPSILVC